MNRLSETLARGNNNFDLIRLMAALAVMLGHSYGIQAFKGFGPMMRFSHLESLGSVAVYSFFLISGMFVSASFCNQRSLFRFVGLRALRIWPGAIVCAIFMATVVGSVFSSLSFFSYVADPGILGWLFHNTTLIEPVGGFLPGLFEANHLKGLVNATVWTLPVELKCYGIVLIVGLLGALRSKWVALVVIVMLAVGFVLLAHQPTGYLHFGNFFLLAIGYSFYPVPFFLAGMLLYAFREHVVIWWVPLAVLFALYMLTRFSWASTILFYITLAYGLLWLGSVAWLRRWVPKHDYSYGIYLYGFVVQQAVSSVYPSMNNYLSLLIAVPITVGLAALSWHWVELPCMATFRRRIAGSRSPPGLAIREPGV